MPPQSPPIIQQLMERFELGPSFTRAYLQAQFTTPELEKLSLVGNELTGMNLPLNSRMWFDFALSTNQRGDAFYHELAQELPAHGKRYLDVGCGYGGFLLAFQRRGYQVVGVDIEPDLVRLSQANLADHGVEALVLTADILDRTLRTQVGTFDVITCNDVIEHVEDVPACLDRLVDFLNPGGVLGLKIPNRDSLNFVASDGHYNLFGLTLLTHRDAETYHSALLQPPYGVGEYYPLAYYRRELEKRACRSKVIHAWPYPRFRQAAAFFGRVLSRYGESRFLLRQKLSPALYARLERKLAAYLLGCLLASANPLRVEAFKERYLADTWTLVAVKA